MPSVIALDDTLGAVLVGVIASAVIYGITMLQMYNYFSDLGRKDGLYLRVFVFALAFFDTVHLSLVSHSLYWYVITNFGDYFSILKIEWSMILQVPLGGVLGVSVQGFFARRIYILSQGRALPICIIIGLLAAAEMSMMIAVAYMAFQIRFIAETYKQTPYLMAAVSLELACNITITCSMVYYLWQGRSGLKKTDGIVKKLVFYSVESGSLIAAAAAAIAGVFISDPNHMIYTPFFFVLIRLYPCTFVTTLNTRKSVRAELNSGGGTRISLAGMGTNSSHSSDKRIGSGRPHPHAVSTLRFGAPTSEGTVTFDIADAADKRESQDVGNSSIE